MRDGCRYMWRKFKFHQGGKEYGSGWDKIWGKKASKRAQDESEESKAVPGPKKDENAS